MGTKKALLLAFVEEKDIIIDEEELCIGHLGGIGQTSARFLLD